MERARCRARPLPAYPAGARLSPLRLIRRRNARLIFPALPADNTSLLAALVIVGHAAIGARASNICPPGTTGNCAPSGPHFDLNLHGVAKGQGFTTSGTSNNIWAPIDGNCIIDLKEGATYQVLNPDCVTSGSNAQFELPNPCADLTCSTFTYQVYVRLVAGTKGAGSAGLQSCYTDTTNVTYCARGTTIRLSHPSKFENVSNALLEVCLVSNTTTLGGTLEPIFSNSAYQNLWDYDNNGIRLAQLRFYPITASNTVGSNCTAAKGNG